ncbi:trypsin-like peptidase domain-containing protein [Flavobacterium sp. NPDC079362]|uniref:trypsin-like peptidase domain-containing protein n=1 Tax=Flavobacterium sp. NPDC079362 TaxID=3390566 RepID=UPI003D026210
MPKTLLEKCCARTHIENNSNVKENQGSGVLIKDDNKFYLLTAEHCIYGKDDEFKDISPDKVWVEVQDSFESDFRRVLVKSIIDVNKNDDWVLLELENPNLDCDYLRINKGHSFINDDEVWFIGYQSKMNDRFRKFDAIINHIAKEKNSFVITRKTGSFQHPTEEAADIAQGLSGSGVFIIRGNSIHLIGHIKSVVGDIALENDLNCCPISCLDKILKDSFVDLSSIDEIEKWEKESENIITNQDIENWKNDKVDDFDNILRKHLVLHPDEKAKKITHSRIIEFLSLKHKIDKMRIENSKPIEQFEKSASIFENRVKEYYTRDADRNEAKNLSIELEDDFSKFIKDIYKDDSNVINTELARHKITEWFMNCSFDFRE